MDGRDVRLGAEQGAVAHHQRFAAEVKAFVEQFPELFLVALGEDADLWQIDGNDALIETPLEFIIAVFVFPRGKKGAASHRAEHVAFVDLAHFLGGNVVGIQALGRAFYGKFGDIIVLAAL